MSDPDGYMNVIAVRVADGTEALLTRERWAYVGQLSWVSDGSALVIMAKNQGHTRNQLWRLEYPGGRADRITNDLNEYKGVSLTADSAALVSVQNRSLTTIWVAPQGDPGRSRQVPFDPGEYDNITDVTWTPDGRIIFSANAGGKWDLWIVDADGTTPRQLTFDGAYNGAPSVSADGRHIFYCSSRTGASQVWRIDAEGGNPKQLTSTGGVQPGCSPDGRWVVYVSISALGKYALWKVGSDGGEPIKLSDASFAVPAVSPDGRLIAGVYADERSDSTYSLAVMPVQGGNPIVTLGLQAQAMSKKNSRLPSLQWAPDGRAISYVNPRTGESGIWSQPLDGGLPKPIADFGADETFSHAWGPAGQLAYTRTSQFSQIVLIKDSSR
jgi:Tol biopolymer transport system component